MRIAPAQPETGLQSWQWGLSTGRVLTARCPLEEHCSGHQEARVLDSTLPLISGMTLSPCLLIYKMEIIMTSFLLRVEKEFMWHWVQSYFCKICCVYICDLCFTQGPRAPTPLPITLSWPGRQEQGREGKIKFLTESLLDPRLDFKDRKVQEWEWEGQNTNNESKQGCQQGWG